MPVGLINTAKELLSSFQPLLLADITLSDGTTFYIATHDVVYGGNAYRAAILNKDISASQAMSEQGIDILASINLRLADADYFYLNNAERLRGFKGSKLFLRFVLYDALTGEFSTDSRVVMRGICKVPGGALPTHDGKVLTVTYVSRLAMADIQIPTARIQRTCIYLFPETLAQRQAGADNATSPFYQCGYSPDVASGNARGSLVGGTVATTCNYSKDDCVARGMFYKDSSNRITGRYGGIQWNPPQVQTVREYRSGNWVTLDSGSNEARYGERLPLLLGMQWTTPIIVTRVPDGNFLQMEALICFGEVEYIYSVVVNGVQIPHTYNDSEMPNVPPGISNDTEAHRGGWWLASNRGDRDGATSFFQDGLPVGDPHGSMCVLHIAVPRIVADVNSSPNVRVLARSKGTNSDLPANQVQSLLQDWVGLADSELNLSEFTTAMDYEFAAIPFKNQNGVNATRHRFTSSLYLRQPESVADLIRGIRNSARLIIAPDSNGLIGCRTKQTLAKQQPSPVSGSNYNTPVASKLPYSDFPTLIPDGTPANGYVAYRFDESNILEPPIPTIIAAGNRYTVNFQNSDNYYTEDAFNPIDGQDIARMGQEIPGGFTVRGADSYDQLRRIFATWMSEQNRGNWRGDSGGSVTLSFPASMRGVHLRMGDIVMVNWQPLALANQLFRIVSIKPETNFERAIFGVQWHNDDWYLDAYGQNGKIGFDAKPRDKELRPSYAWLPYMEQPALGDSIFARTDWNFAVTRRYSAGEGGAAVVKVGVTGRQAVNTMVSQPKPPSLPIQGNTSAFGGSIPGGRAYYFSITAKNSAGKQSSPSNLIIIGVPAGTNTNVITIPGLYWDTGTVGYAVYGGTDPNRLTAQVEGVGAPSSISVSSLNVATWGMPDGEFNILRLRTKRVMHSGLWGAEVQEFTSSTLKFATPDPGFTTNQWVNYDITWLGRKTNPGPLPIANWRVVSNNIDTLTLSGPDPTAIGVEIGDIFVMRCKPVYGTDGSGQYLEDMNWRNCFYPDGLSGDESGFLIHIFGGTGRGQVVKCTSNTATRHYADFPFPMSGSTRYLLAEQDWKLTTESSPVDNDDPQAVVYAELDVNAYQTQTLLIQAFTVDGGDNESYPASSPIREVYLPATSSSFVIQISTQD